MARELITDASGKVTAVSYIDKTTGAEQQVRCRTVVLSAAACESARLLLNSKSSRHPHGLANANGQVGKYLTDTVGFGMSAPVPALAGTPVFNSDGYGAHLYIPWWMLDRHKELDFPRGYHVEVGGGGFGMPGLGFGAGTYNQQRGLRPADEAGDPRELRRHDRQPERPRRDGPERGLLLRDRSRREGQVGHPGAALPLEVERLRDQPGAAHARQSFRAILETMGGTVNAGRGGGGGRGRGQAGAAAGPPAPAALRHPQLQASAQGNAPPTMGAGGGVIHEVGCVRMGDDPRTSVLNKFCRAHHVPNLFVADGGPFVSHADKNPTHTIIALAWRTAEYLAEEMRKGNV